MNTMSERWEKVLALVKENNKITEIAYKVWLEPLMVSERRINNGITVLVPVNTGVAYEYVQRKYGHMLREAVREVFGEDLEIHYGVKAMWIDGELVKQDKKGIGA